MSNREFMRDLSQAQVADLMNNLMDTFSDERKKIFETLSELDVSSLVVLTKLVALTSSNRSTNEILVKRINRLQKQQGRRVEYKPLTKRRRLQLEMEIVRAVSGDQTEIKGLFLGTLKAVLATTHIMDDKALIPRSVKKRLKRKDSDEEEDFDFDF